MLMIARNLCHGLVLGVIVALIAVNASAEPIAADAIYRATGVQGGLVVHLGCDDGQLTAALHANDRYLVHGLDTDPAQVAQTRDLLHAKGLYGPVSADCLHGRQLPYVGNLVNLVVASELGQVTMDEILRVLAPEGVAYVRRGDQWTKTVKPRPADIDEWSHFLHDSGGNAVANDQQIGSPRHLRWVAHPRWCRTHEFPSSVEAVVTSGGRIFTIFDEGPVGIYRKMPQDCKLIARDAANGVLLWKVPMRQWQPEFGTGTGNRWNIHHTIPRRLIAQGDRVYVTLGFLDSPVSVLDAATGEILTEALPDTLGADEMVLCGDVLIVKKTKGRSIGATQRIGKDALNDTLVAIDVSTGKRLWRLQDTRVLPYALSAKAGRVVYHDMEHLICLDAKTGDQKWKAPSPITSTLGGGSTLVLIDGVVLFHGQLQGPPATGSGKQAKPGLYLTAHSLDEGKGLWRRGGKRSLAGACNQPTDLFVADAIVWCGNSLDGYDLRTGEVRKTLSLDNLISPGHHFRCHRGKATERFLIWPKRGAEFIDLTGDEHMRNDWLRAPCFTGPTPANGLLYVPPSPCHCYPGAKVFGFLALASEDDTADGTWKAAKTAPLEKGPAYGERSTSAADPVSDWPMYRNNIQRSGSTKSPISADLAKRWEIDLAGRATQPVVVGDRLFVAERDTHRIRCFSTDKGKALWSFTAGGRIDSAPTIDDGRVLFGCRDGSVYCLRATDGALIWRFRAAPDTRRIVSYGQVESLWPVQGSVLVQEGTVYFAAGRSSFLDGGIHVFGLDVQTGEVLHRHLLEGPWPDIKEDVGTPFAMEGALADLLVSDGEDLYMQRIKFDAELNRLETTQESSLGELDMGKNHLVATGGFLDDTGFDRLFWMYGKRWPGFYFAQHSPKAGQLVVFDEETTFAVKYFYRRHIWSPLFIPAEQGYLLFADDNDNEPALDERGRKVAIEWLPEGAATDQYKRGGRGSEKGTGYVRTRPAKWQTMVPLRIRAMVATGDHLFAAGLPDVLDPDDPLAALEGRAGAILQVYSTEDGAPVKSIPLTSPPAFDGLSAAAGQLYLATLDGKIICFGASDE